MGTPRLWLLVAASALTAYGQEDYSRHSFTIGMGASQPRGDLRYAFKSSFVLGANYGFRFHRYFQADAGLDTVFQAARVRDFLPSAFGSLRIRDFEFLVPLGGRVVVPLGSERVLFHAGGGGAYLRYTERLQQPFQGVQFGCAECGARSGWGYYGLVGGSAALDRDGHFRLGAESRVYRGRTEGDPLGDVRRTRTTDRWINILGTFTFSF